MKKRIFALIFIGITLLTAIIITGCSNDNADKDLSITEFIDEHVAQFSNNHEVYGIYYKRKFVKTKILPVDGWISHLLSCKIMAQRSPKSG